MNNMKWIDSKIVPLPTTDLTIIEISYDGINVDTGTEWMDKRTCMMAGIAGGNGYFGPGWGTNGESGCNRGLICDAPSYWRYQIDDVVSSEKTLLRCKFKADLLIKKFKTIIVEELSGGDKLFDYSAIQCSLTHVSEMIAEYNDVFKGGVSDQLSFWKQVYSELIQRLEETLSIDISRAY
jgi:hypothetical protein